MKTIGIVAVTPKSGLDVFQYLVKKAHETRGVSPRMFIESTPLEKYMKAFDEIKSGNKASLVHQLISSLEALARAGCEIAIIPNNSSLIVLDEVQRLSPILVLSLVDVVIDNCTQQKLKRIAIFAPSPVINGKVYQNPIEKAGLSVVVPSESEQTFLQKAIIAATQGEEISIHTAKKVREIYSHLNETEGFDGAIIACSELYRVLPPPGATLPILNPFNLIADKVLTMLD